MTYEQIADPELQYLKSLFSEHSLIRNKAKEITEIRLPDFEGHEAMRVVRALENIGVILTGVSYKNGKLELAIRRPDAIALMLDKVIQHTVDVPLQESPVLEVGPDTVAREWGRDQLVDIQETNELKQVDSDEDGFNEPYTADVLDLMEQEAVFFYRGLTGDENLDVKAHHPRYATDGKILKQKFVWEAGQLFKKDGTPVTVAEQRELLEAAKTSEAALATVCQIHEGLVRWVAEKHDLELGKRVDHLVDMDDLLQAGREGMVKALRRVELSEDENKVFTTGYLIDYIKGGMLNAIHRERGGKVLRPPVHVHRTDYKVFRNEAERQKEEHGFLEPDLEELRKKTQFDVKKVRDLYQAIRQMPEEYDDENPEHQQDYYRPGEQEHEEDREFGNQFDNYSQKNLEQVMNQVLATLRPREERVIRLRFFHDKTLEEIGLEYGVFRERVRQIEARALRNLKHPSRSRKLRSFLDD